MYTHKKSLGQHFLKDEAVIQKIVAVLKKETFAHLLEVGPGAGALTKYLMELPAIDFRAVEQDEEKVVYLLKKYPALQNKIIHQSFLDMNEPFDSPFLNKKGSPTILPTEVIRSTTEEKEFQIKTLQAFHKRHENKSAAMLKHLQQAAVNNENIFAELMETVKYCSLGQITNALYAVGGQYRRNM